MKAKLGTLVVILLAIALVNPESFAMSHIAQQQPIVSMGSQFAATTTSPVMTHIAQQSQQPTDPLALFGHGFCLYQAYYLSLNGSGRFVSRCPVGGSPRLSSAADVRQRTYLLANPKRIWCIISHRKRTVRIPFILAQDRYGIG
eukprot:130440_1